MHRRTVTRRDFLLRTVGAATGVELGRRLAGGDQGLAARAENWPNAAVIQGTNQDTPAVILETALAAVGGIERFVKPGQTVCIKPNCTWDYPPKTASSTDPDLLVALIKMVQQAGAKHIIVLDHPTISSAAECLEVSGIGKALEGLDVEKVFPDRTLAPADTYQVIDLPQAKSFPKISVVKAALAADVRINMAVAKSHVVLPVTLCLKHMMGFLESPPALHADLEQGVSDINTESPIHCDLHILEALRVRLKGMAAGTDTDLTNPRLVKRFNQLVVGTDPVLIDSYACINYFGRQPREIRYIKMAGDRGLGEADVKKATAEGRLQVYRAGLPLTPLAPAAGATTAPASPTAAPEAGTTPTATAGATNTATAAPTGAQAQAQATGQSSATPTSKPPDTATATTAPSATPSPTATAVLTATPLPTATAEPPLPPGAAAPRGGSESGAPAEPVASGVVSPNRFLSGALLPVAAVVTGAGLVVGRRLWRADAAEPKAAGEQGQAAAEGEQGS